MSETNEHDSAPLTIYCTRCGKAMSVAQEHKHTTVACPHCAQRLEPWRVADAAPPTVPPPEGPAPPPVGGVSPPPPPPPYAGGPQPGYPGAVNYGVCSSRSKVVAGVLGILFGSLGVHRFYLGFIGIGILQIVLTFATCGVAGIWGFVEGILCLTGSMRDVDDLPLRD